METVFNRDGKPTATLGIRDAAAYLGIGESTMRNMVKKGEIKATRVRNSIKLCIEELNRYLRKNIILPRS